MIDKIVAYDWQENPIYESDGENYFKTDYGYVFDGFMSDDINDFMIHLFGMSRTIHEWLESEVEE